MINHERYLRRCIELSKLSNGLNRPNPEVGSVIVCNNTIIGEGYHKCYGQAHAEVNAIASVDDQSLLAESTIYVTLEPCFHFGKTPPCVELILKHKIPRVVIGCTDPYHEVAGKSIEKLRKAGVEVTVGILNEEVECLNRRFFTNVRNNRPFIVLKYAVSADGFMGRTGENLQISGPISKRWVHKLRSEEAAILVGTETALSDNPQLNVRHYFGPQPLRLVLDRTLRLPDNLHLFDGTQPTAVFTENFKVSEIENLEYIQIPFGTNDFLFKMLDSLYKMRIVSVLVEGGASLLNSFLASGLWDEAYILRSNNVRLESGIEAPQIQAKYFTERSILGEDSLEHYQHK